MFESIVQTKDKRGRRLSALVGTSLLRDPSGVRAGLTSFEEALASA